MSAATVVQIVAWGAKLLGYIIDLIKTAVEAAQSGNAPSLDDLDKRLGDHLANDAKERAAAYAKDVSDAEARVREVAAREYSDGLKTVLEKPKKP